MPKFTELEKGTLVKEGTEYDYVIEIADDFPRSKGVRVRVIEERPKIRKIRTRYDPEIKMYGEEGASMELVLGYNWEEIKNTFRFFISLTIFPFYIAFLVWFFTRISRWTIPKSWLLSLLFLLVPVLIYLIFRLGKGYFSLVMSSLADYLKARDLKKILMKEGFKTV